MAEAHVGPVFYAQEVIPSTITIDGRGDDPGWNAPLWDWANTIDKEMLGGNLAGGQMPPDDDWDGLLKVGFSRPPENMLYFYSSVSDDHLIKEAWSGYMLQDDALGILVDANHDGGEHDPAALPGTSAQAFLIKMSEADVPHAPSHQDEDTRALILYSEELGWMSGPPWMTVHVERPVGHSGVTYAYEGKMALWDRGGDSPQTSARHVNAPGQEVGLSFWWDDADAIAGQPDDQPATQGPDGTDAWRDADTWGNFVFVTWACSAVGVTSWGAVKASFQR